MTWPVKVCGRWLPDPVAITDLLTGRELARRFASAAPLLSPGNLGRVSLPRVSSYRQSTLARFIRWLLPPLCRLMLHSDAGSIYFRESEHGNRQDHSHYRNCIHEAEFAVGEAWRHTHIQKLATIVGLALHDDGKQVDAPGQEYCRLVAIRLLFVRAS